jgi:hypothetical protein
MPGIASKHRDSITVNTISFSHADVDQRLLMLVEACVAKIDADPKLVAIMRRNITRWSAASFARRMGATAVAPVA